jgi:hypothetical protein
VCMFWRTIGEQDGLGTTRNRQSRVEQAGKCLRNQT